MSDSFRIVTVCNRFPTESYYCLNEFIKSLGEHKVLVLGTRPGEYAGLGSKPKLLRQAIKNGLIPEKNTLFTDCWDMVFAVDPTILMIKFKYANTPISISAEKNCFPSDLKEDYDKLQGTGSSYKYLNSGMIVGNTDAILTALEAMDLDNVPDDYRNEDGSMTHINDQFLWQQTFLKQPVKITLDYNQVLCNTLHSVKLDELDFSETQITNKETGTYPCAFHMNGSAKTDGLREPILKHLNL